MNHGRGLVTFTLFGDLPLYTEGAIKNAKLWKLFLDVDCRFYVGKSVPEQTLVDLANEGAQIRYMTGPEDQTATMWRYEAFQEYDGYDYILSRDVDSRPSERELTVVNEWLESNLPFHIIRDHPYHGVPILAGLFGVKAPLFGLMAEILPSSVPDDFYKVIVKACNHVAVAYTSNDFYQVDQWWLRLNVYPKLRNKILSHDAFFGFERKRYRRELPLRDEDNSFIAECHTENDELRHPDHRDLFNVWPSRQMVRRPR